MTPRFALKEATADVHGRLDTLLSQLDLGREGDYRQFLLIQARIVPALESALERAGIGDLVDNWSDHRRADFLRKDLEELGAAMPQPLAVPLPSGEAEVLGASYVLEGSRLGAKMLVRSVASGMPDSFLNPPTENPWPALVAALDRYLYSTQRLEDAKRAANACFEAFLAAARGTGLR